MERGAGHAQQFLTLSSAPAPKETGQPTYIQFHKLAATVLFRDTHRALFSSPYTDGVAHKCLCRAAGMRLAFWRIDVAQLHPL